MKEKTYELTYLITPSLTQEDATAFHEKIKSIIKKDCQEDKEQFPKKIALAYQIEEVDEAYLACIDFQTTSDKINDLQKNLKKEKSIIRFLLVEKPKEKIIIPRERTKDKPVQKKRSLKPEKTKLQELDKKIDEIL